TVLVLALAAAFAPAHAEEDLSQYLKPQSTVAVGLAHATGSKDERAIFGQYNGVREHNSFLLFDLDYVTRDDGSGTWTIATIKDLGLADRELSVQREVQGSWKAYASYSELERDYPRTVNSGLAGAGTTTPTVARVATPGAGSDIELKTTRKAATLGYERFINSSLSFEMNFKNETKDGARLWGRGYDCAAYVCGTSTTTAINQAAFVKNALLLLPEPINATTRQVEARLVYSNDKLNVNGGYNGSFYNNAYGSMSATVPNLFNNGLGNAFPGYPAVTGAIIAGGGTSLQNVLQLPTALPPDNQAHQFYVDGNYAFTPKMRMTFKYAYSVATQNENFASMGLTDAPAGVTSLNGKVVSQLAQLGLSARPADGLQVIGNMRYEHKEDKTPSALYNVEPVAVVPATTPASSTTVGAYWNNNHVTSTRFATKLEANYRFPLGIRGTLGGDYTSIEREVPDTIADEKVAGLSALRARNYETTYRGELRRSMGETLNGGVSYSTSRRTGSDWTSLSQLDPATKGISATNLALINAYCGGLACYGQEMKAASILGFSATTPFPMTMTDLKRDKWKLSADWNPLERLSMQLVLETGRDTNLAPLNPVVGGKGWRDSSLSVASLDVSYAFSDKWSLTGFASRNQQTLHINHSTGYLADLHNEDSAAGLMLLGKPTSALELGATLSFLTDVNAYNLGASNTTTGTLPGPLTAVAPSAANLAQAAIGLPDASFRQLGLKLFAQYAVQKQAHLRVTLGQQRIHFTEYQWSVNGVPFTYADNTTVHMLQQQNTGYLAISYIRTF
ncbi:MAG: MtrB/PioB family decaheme-associated outer membrane protein, partial [Pseudomonadota bacterium]